MVHHLLLWARQGTLGGAEARHEVFGRPVPGSGTSTASALGEALGRGTSKSEGNLRGSNSTRLLGTASALGEALGRGILTSEGNPRGSDGPSRERAPARGSVRKNQDFPQAVFFSNRDPPRVRLAQENLAVSPPLSYHPLPQDMSVTLVADLLISSRSRMFSLVIPCQ